MIQIKEILNKLRKLDEKIEHINTVNCTIDVFLTKENTLIDATELKLLLEDLEISKLDNSYLEKIRIFISEYENHLDRFKDIKEMRTDSLIGLTQ